MNKSPRVLGLLLVAVFASQGALCGKKPAVQPPPPPRPTPQPPPPPRVPTEDEVFAQKSITQLNDEHPIADVFFDYDLADLADSSRMALQKAADWLRRWSSVRVTVEGHADSRGTNEYNLALGERRASAVRDYLVGLGIPAARIAIVSKGEEEPLCKDEVESCWSQNRRGHFVITEK